MENHKVTCGILFQHQESNFCTELWLVTKNGFILKTSEADPSTPRPSRFGKKPCFVSGGTRAVLFIMKSWSLEKPLKHNAIVNKFESCINQKATGMGQKTWQSDFVTRHSPISHIKTSKRHLEIAWMGHPFAPTVILWLGGIWLSPLLINGIPACRAALQQFRRSVKMAQWMFCRKTKTVFQARYS